MTSTRAQSIVAGIVEGRARGAEYMQNAPAVVTGSGETITFVTELARWTHPAFRVEEVEASEAGLLFVLPGVSYLVTAKDKKLLASAERAWQEGKLRKLQECRGVSIQRIVAS